jgi:hypothetical protein
MKKFIFVLPLIFSTIADAMEDRKETKFLIVHHSLSINGSVETIRPDHKKRVDEKGRSWEDIGYHFVITNGKGGPDGEIQIGRPIEKVGAHAKGRNLNSIGICLVGTDKFTDKQIVALVKLLANLCDKYDLDPMVAIQRHHKTCPGPGLNL